MDNSRDYVEAKRAVNAKFGFLVHLTIYLIVNIMLLGINLLTSPGYLWFMWPVMGWGIGIVFHFLAVYVLRGHSLKDRMLERELRNRGTRT